MSQFLKTINAFILLFVISSNVYSQADSPIQLGTDFMNRYIWRGLNLGGDSPNIQPWVKYNHASSDNTHAISIGAWSAYTFSQTSNQEVDLFVTYTYKGMLSLTVTDYYFPGYFKTGQRAKYFNYNSDSTGHVFEGTISFNGTENIPFTCLFSMNFYGNDAHKINSDGSTGKIFMSKYIEVGYKKNIKGVDFNIFAGAALDKPNTDRGEFCYYGNKSVGIINLGLKASKSIQISDKFSLPVQTSFITNPEAENVFFVFGFSF